jgi:hypothetical protein
MSSAGIVQFCRGAIADERSGTCLDDNARVWLVAIAALCRDPGDPEARAAGDTALRFLRRAQRPDGLFHNLASIDGGFLDEVGSEDSFGRAVWACGVAARCTTVPEWRRAATAVLAAALPAIRTLRYPHARAYAMLGLAAALAPEAATELRPSGVSLDSALQDNVNHALVALADGSVDEFNAAATSDWRWWSQRLAWGNGRLPEALLRAAAATGNRRYASVGLRAFEFLAGITQFDGILIPIGNDGWYTRGGTRACFDQQPIEVCAMVDAWLAAYRLRAHPADRAGALTAYAWFLGNNTEKLALAVPEIGACHDGLMPGRVNENQGAESTLSYLHASLAIGALSLNAPPGPTSQQTSVIG